MKKLMSMLICILLVIPAPVTAATQELTDGYFYYTVENRKATLTDYSDLLTDEVIELPSVLGGYPVTAIGKEAFIHNHQFKKIIIPDSVISIEEGAFWNTDLEKITLGNNIVSIGEDAFCNNRKLIRIDIPESVKEISPGAFFGCSSLAEINVDQNNPNYCSVDGNLFNKDKSVLLQYSAAKPDTSYEIPDGVLSISDGAFSSCFNLAEIVIPNSVKSIGFSAFYCCINLVTLTIPSTVTFIGDYAFSKSGITNITIPKGISFIGEETFNECRNLTEVSLPESVTSIGKKAFYKCEKLNKINLPEQLSFLGERAFFLCKSLPKISIPHNITCIETQTFYGCISMNEITIPDTVTLIKDHAFGSSGLEKVILPDSITSLPDHVFSYCKNLTEVIIPNSVTSIGEDAFSKTSLASITLPDSITEIKANTFSDCQNLTEIVIPNSVTSIGKYAFARSGLLSVTIPKKLSFIDYSAFSQCNNLAEINVDPNNSQFCSVNGNLLSKDQSVLLQYAGGKEASVYTIPDSVTSIGWYAFSHCNNLTEVIIPNSVTSIGAGAFSYSTLAKISIPDTITSIENNAFYGCDNLSEILIPNSITSIGQGAFYSCNNLTEIVIPDSVTSIGKEAFSYSGLKNVTLPNIPLVEESAFSHCEDLGNVFFKGTTDEWDIIAKAFQPNNFLVHFDYISNEIPDLTILINNKKVTFPQLPLMENGRTLVDADPFFEALGAKVLWVKTTATSTRNNTTISFIINSPQLFRNGQKIPLDVPAKQFYGRTLVPLRAIAENFGFSVEWDDTTKTITITE